MTMVSMTETATVTTPALSIMSSGGSGSGGGGGGGEFLDQGKRIAVSQLTVMHVQLKRAPSFGSCRNAGRLQVSKDVYGPQAGVEEGPVASVLRVALLTAKIPLLQPYTEPLQPATGVRNLSCLKRTWPATCSRCYGL